MNWKRILLGIGLSATVIFGMSKCADSVHDKGLEKYVIISTENESFMIKKGYVYSASPREAALLWALWPNMDHINSSNRDYLKKVDRSGRFIMVLLSPINRAPFIDYINNKSKYDSEMTSTNTDHNGLFQSKLAERGVTTDSDVFFHKDDNGDVDKIIHCSKVVDGRQSQCGMYMKIGSATYAMVSFQREHRLSQYDEISHKVLSLVKKYGD